MSLRPANAAVCQQANSSNTCVHFQQIINIDHLNEVSKKVPSWIPLDDEERAQRLLLLTQALQDHDFTEERLRLPCGEEDSSDLQPSALDLLAASIHAYLGQRLVALSSSYSVSPNAGYDPSDLLDEITEIHRNSAGHLLRFEVGRIRCASIRDALKATLPTDLRCIHLITFLHIVSMSNNPDQYISSLRDLINDILLSPLDNQIADLGVGYLRHSAHGIVTSLSTRMLETAEQVVRAHTHSSQRPLLMCEQTYVAPDEDFAFLSSDITRAPTRTPSHDPHADQVLYVGKDGARLNVAKGRLVITANSLLPELSLPCNLVSRIVLSGNVGLSAGARSWALRSDIPVTFLSRRGGYQGRLTSTGALHRQRLIQQVTLTQDREQALHIAQAIVQAKLRNLIHVLHRLARRTPNADVTSACQTIRALSDECLTARTHHQLMGIEGAASEVYFSTVPDFLPDNVRFTGRSRRPPRDLANAALSYGYAILLSECVGALIACGLEPSLGVLHSVTDKRPSLALDLMEEFRPLLVDQTVFSLLRGKRLRPEHAITHPPTGAVWLGRDGKKTLTDAYEATLQRSVRGALPGFAGSWRRHIGHEAQLLARAIMEPSYQWSGVVWR